MSATSRSPRFRLPGLERLRRRAAIRRQQLALADLSDHLLDDIGLSREAAIQAAQRPLWDAPDHWRRRP